jgi:hypothetical protein
MCCCRCSCPRDREKDWIDWPKEKPLPTLGEMIDAGALGIAYPVEIETGSRPSLRRIRVRFYRPIE